MKLFAFLTAAAAAVVVSAHAEPIADRERAVAAQAQAEQQRRIDQARERCIANRGTDCDTLEGLREWLLLDRSRADAVLDRVYPNASGGSSSSITVNPSAPQTSPRNQ
jgi:hypothetical protein